MILDQYGQQKIMRIAETMGAHREIRVLISSTKLRTRWER
jgi:hypothetical protein